MGFKGEKKRTPKELEMTVKVKKEIGLKNNREILSIKVDFQMVKGRSAQIEFECLGIDTRNVQRATSRSLMNSDGSVDDVDGKFEVTADHISVGDLTVTYRDGKMVVASDVKTHIEFVTTREEFDLFINQVKFIVE